MGFIGRYVDKLESLRDVDVNLKKRFEEERRRRSAPLLLDALIG